MNVAIFIDYDNISICLEKYYELYNITERKDLKTKLIERIIEKFKNDKIIICKAFADFQKVNSTLTVLQKNQVELRHIYSSNQRKNASDIALVIDVIKSLYSKNIVEKYVLISSDSDMLPVINEVRYFGKDIEVICSDYASSDYYKDYKFDISMIETLLNLKSYNQISTNDLKKNFEKHLNIINDGINSIFKKYNNGTTNKSNLCEYIYENIEITRSDAMIIIENMLKLGFISESKINNSIYSKLLINENRVNKKELNLKNDILQEKSFKNS